MVTWHFCCFSLHHVTAFETLISFHSPPVMNKNTQRIDSRKACDAIPLMSPNHQRSPHRVVYPKISILWKVEEEKVVTTVRKTERKECLEEGRWSTVRWLGMRSAKSISALLINWFYFYSFSSSCVLLKIPRINSSSSLFWRSFEVEWSGGWFENRVPVSSWSYWGKLFFHDTVPWFPTLPSFSWFSWLLIPCSTSESFRLSLGYRKKRLAASKRVREREKMRERWDINMCSSHSVIPETHSTEKIELVSVIFSHFPSFTLFPSMSLFFHELFFYDSSHPVGVFSKHKIQASITGLVIIWCHKPFPSPFLHVPD